jgi:hypothetical protein
VSGACEPLHIEHINSLSAATAKPLCAFVLRAVQGVRYPGATPTQIYDELWRNAENPGWGLFVGYIGRHPRALGLVILPTVLMMAPQVPIAYNEGPPQLMRMMGMRLREWLVAHGHDRFLGWNIHHSDAAFMRAFRHAGTPRLIGTLVEFRL